MADRSSVSLARLAGFEVSLGEDGGLVFGEGVLAPEPAVRRLEDLSQVLLAPGERAPPLYLMYRGRDSSPTAGPWRTQGSGMTSQSSTRARSGRSTLRLRSLPSESPGHPWTYPEIYQVLYGRAHFLMQRGGEVSGQVDDFVVADFAEGDIL